MSQSTFPLSPELSAKLKDTSSVVHYRDGLVVLRGFQPTEYSRDDNILIYVGITTHVAKKRTWMGKSLVV